MKNIASTAKGSDASDEESGDELGVLSDSDIGDIFNSLGKKPKTGTTPPNSDSYVDFNVSLESIWD